jgi:hypothetical protein
MKTFTKTLIAAGAGLLGMCGAANAATPYGPLTSTQGIAVGGCYKPNDPYCNTYDGCFGSTYNAGRAYDDYAYRPLPSRSVYDSQRGYHTLPYPTSGWNGDRWDNTVGNHRRYDDFNDYGMNHRSKSSATIFDRDHGRFDNRRYEDRYDGSPMFEPWRPMSVSNTSLRW